MKRVNSLATLQDEIAVLHAALTIGGGYDALERRWPKIARRLSRVGKACVKASNARFIEVMEQKRQKKRKKP